MQMSQNYNVNVTLVINFINILYCQNMDLKNIDFYSHWYGKIFRTSVEKVSLFHRIE